MNESTAEKCQKLSSLVPSMEEWIQVRLLCNVLQVRHITLAYFID